MGQHCVPSVSAETRVHTTAFSKLRVQNGAELCEKLEQIWKPHGTTETPGWHEVTVGPPGWREEKGQRARGLSAKLLESVILFYSLIISYMNSMHFDSLHPLDLFPNIPLSTSCPLLLFSSFKMCVWSFCLHVWVCTICMYVCVHHMHACVYVCMHHILTYLLSRGQKRVSEPLELEL